MSRKVSGICHLCGEYKELSKEHVPPQKAFNESKAFTYSGDKAIGRENLPWDTSGLKGTQHQNGVGFYTLCEKCNSDTGGWYGRAFIEFMEQGFILTRKRNLQSNSLTGLTFREIYPLRIFKQIVTMFFSINTERLAKIHPELKGLVSEQKRMGIPKDSFGFYIYLQKGELLRYLGISHILSLGENGARLISELSAPPFGFVLEINPVDKRGYCDIADFANLFHYDDRKDIKLVLPVLECNTYFPLDYRTKEEVIRLYLENKLGQMKRIADGAGH